MPLKPTQNQAHNHPPPANARSGYETTESFHRITDVLKCKWTIAILKNLDAGHTRPSELQHQLPGLTSKVLNERLKKLETFNLIEREAFPEVPPRVEYTITSRGSELTLLLKNLIAYIDRWDNSTD